MNTLTTSWIDKTVCVELGALGPNLQKHIYDKIKTEMENSCDKELGYIFTVNDNIKILPNNSISTAGPTVFFPVRFQIESLKPVIGQKYTGRVGPILQIGIFVEVENKMKILVLTKNMNGYVFDKNIFRKGKKDLVIKTGQTITVELTMFQFENQQFSFLGKLVKVHEPVDSDSD